MDNNMEATQSANERMFHKGSTTSKKTLPLLDTHLSYIYWDQQHVVQVWQTRQNFSSWKSATISVIIQTLSTCWL